MSDIVKAHVLRAWAGRLERGEEKVAPIWPTLRQRDRDYQLASAARLRAKADELMPPVTDEVLA